MNDIWDIKADAVKKGDNLRDVSSLYDKTKTDENGITHYIFKKNMFKNPWYNIPKKNLDLFKDFLNGGSRQYPSDGNIPCDVVAGELRQILNKIMACSEDSNHVYYKDACDSLKDGKLSLLRGTMKIYLKKYASRDWRRKRFTDDIDFWCFNVNLLEYILKKLGWKKNKKTGEWEKKVEWINPYTNEHREETLFAANNLNQLLDFGAGSYLEGSELKKIFTKKLKRGHDVDLSDIINIAMESHIFEGKMKEEWLGAWSAFEEAANTRNTRITSNLISLSSYSYAIADYLERVGKVLVEYHELIYDKNEYPDESLKEICQSSIHWQNFLETQGLDATRKMIHEFLVEQAKIKPLQSKNLREFTEKILKLLNSKYGHLKVVFEIETE